MQKTNIESFDIAVVGVGLTGGYLGLELLNTAPKAKIVFLDQGRLDLDNLRAAKSIGNWAKNDLPKTSCPPYFQNWPERATYPAGGRSWCWQGALIAPTQSELNTAANRLSFANLRGCNENWFQHSLQTIADTGYLGQSSENPCKLSNFKPYPVALSNIPGTSNSYVPLKALSSFDRRTLSFRVGCSVDKITSGSDCAIIHYCQGEVRKELVASRTIVALDTRSALRLVGNSPELHPQHETVRIWDHLLFGYTARFEQVPKHDDIGLWFSQAEISGISANVFISVRQVGQTSTDIDVWSVAAQDTEQGSHISVENTNRIRTVLSPRDIQTINDLNDLSFAAFQEISSTLHLRVRDRENQTMCTGWVTAKEFHESQKPGIAYGFYSPLGTTDHENGTLRELVDADCRFLNMPTVYAVGPSIFACPLAANPTLTSFSLASMVADRVGKHF